MLAKGLKMANFRGGRKWEPYEQSGLRPSRQQASKNDPSKVRSSFAKA
jgi:hypothetical protein